MSCDLSDPNILVAYNEIINFEGTNWLILGYNDTRDVISLYSKGSGGLSEMRDNLREEVLYGFARLEERYVLITYVSEQVSGVRRARALVHGRAVGALLKAQNASITASNPNDLSDVNIRTRLKLSGENGSAPTTPITPTHPDRPDSPASARRGRPASPSSSADRRTPSLSSISYDAPAPPAPTSPLPSPPLSASSKPPLSRDDAERKARKEENDRVAREEAEKRSREEAERRQAEAADRQRVEQQALESKLRDEAERRAKDESEKAQRETLKKQFVDADKLGQTLLSGYMSVQGGGSPFWKRRYFSIRGKTLYLYRDVLDKNPITSLDLAGTVRGIENVQPEVLIPNSFRLDLSTPQAAVDGGGSYYFFCDTHQEGQTIVAALSKVSGR
ncbi:hypothetical protein BC936DRAFT_138581 [Jimgerdemannia flammicorona]|uniref:ADF-H domain-containing protein n=1 Tax=Jimgerdemannia flammicorona TaxID=994334 RepID=A0A433DIG2_9FUNG|nr:hypothetical protein BC936DRAFT_138581 [Jimgerdemannia flammicorona]